MAKCIFNYGAGPAMLPQPVMEQIQAEFLDYKGMGISVIELNHRTDAFEELLQGAKGLLRDMVGIPADYRIVWSHGGGGMQFSSVPLNLMGLHPQHKAVYCNTGFFSTRSIDEAGKYGTVQVATSSEDTGFDRIPELTSEMVDPDAGYLHITTNNTMMGTRYADFPAKMPVPMVGDVTSEILSRPIDLARFGMIYAGAQKNLGPSGITVIIIKEDLLNHYLPQIARQINYTVLDERDSMPSTPNVFGIYCNYLVLQWTKAQGGPEAMQKHNEAKAARIYGVIDGSDFYRGHAQKGSRSIQNYTFDLPSEELVAKFIVESDAEGLYQIKRPMTGKGLRASLYNAMPMEGAEVLAAFMEDFERKYG